MWFSFLSLWPAAVRISLAQLLGIRSDVNILLLFFLLLFFFSPFLSAWAYLSLIRGLLAGTPLLPLTCDVSTVDCLLSGFQMSVYAEPDGDCFMFLTHLVCGVPCGRVFILLFSDTFVQFVRLSLVGTPAFCLSCVVIRLWV